VVDRVDGETSGAKYSRPAWLGARRYRADVDCCRSGAEMRGEFACCENRRNAASWLQMNMTLRKRGYNDPEGVAFECEVLE
jgi:hypothetical protein